MIRPAIVTERIELQTLITQRLKDGLGANGATPCAADVRIQTYLERTFGRLGPVPKLPGAALALDQAGMARELSLPRDGDSYASPLLKSYRLRNGVLHNPVNDRRTTQGVFHIAEGGLTVPDDKLAVPANVFVQLLARAVKPPPELCRLPYTAGRSKEKACFVSLLLRPLVVPGVPGFITEKKMEVRFFAPGSLVSNLDFVESIFGNAGDPHCPENNAALEPDGWTGHSGCVILAPHLVNARKKELGLPHFDQATARQRRDGMCWTSEDECYNGGSAFKVCTRDTSGVIVTLIADNYYGYCKKEVKTQISYSANLYGLAEEEHAGGALVYPSYDLGEEFSGNLHVQSRGHSFAEMTERYGTLMDFQPEGYAIDKEYRDILYVPENVAFDLDAQTVTWERDGAKQTLPLRAGRTYVRPSGYKVHIEQPHGRGAWHLVGTVAEGTLCHKPCTVSGGGKSEISKPISDAILPGPVFVADFERDMARVDELIAHDYSKRFRDPARHGSDTRSILDGERSLGSVIKLLTPALREYSDEYNSWLRGIPQYLKEIVFVVKRHYVHGWGAAWRTHFSVDLINGNPGNELKCENRKLTASYLRVGYDADGAWRVFGLREDFHPAAKVQMEDDITASVVMPGATPEAPSWKFVENCEARLFQRPDDAIHRGYDKLTEKELAGTGNFISNFQPLTLDDAQEIADEAVGFSKYTAPMKKLIQAAASGEPGPSYFVSSAHPRIVDGKPSKNPRYLQLRPDLVDARGVHLATMATRLHRRLAADAPILTPVTAFVPGRRNNPPEPAARIRPLAVFNPIHYFELPELFMEYISSMTGKSPSTTGAGSEGALTKGPFNALPAIIDLNAALVSQVLVAQPVFVSAAGYVGPKGRMDHDVSLLVPEVWSRMSPAERDPAFLIKQGYLEKSEDFDHEGRSIHASRLGYRITARFARTFFGRVFTHPHSIFTEEMLKPETQDLAIFVDGMDNICATHERVAQSYFADGTIALACPPLQALLHIMAHGHWEGKGAAAPEVRALFARESLLASDWYAARLQSKQRADVALWNRHVQMLESYVADRANAAVSTRLNLATRLEAARTEAARVATAAYLESLRGTLGRQPL
jgi:phosphoenolpyruvate carboxykinase (diphosphate)